MNFLTEIFAKVIVDTHVFVKYREVLCTLYLTSPNGEHLAKLQYSIIARTLTLIQYTDPIQISLDLYSRACVCACVFRYIYFYHMCSFKYVVHEFSPQNYYFFISTTLLLKISTSFNHQCRLKNKQTKNLHSCISSIYDFFINRSHIIVLVAISKHQLWSSLIQN